MQTLITLEEVRSLRQQWTKENHKVAFVPTMGALHDGHLSLMLQARKLADVVIASIFVNPKQFGPSEDFSKYPRTLQDDTTKLNRVGVDAVFLPNAADIYPEGFQTMVTNREMANALCGLSRPGHFDGVLTVVAKLFNLVQPHISLFGKKDYQQWRLIETMVRDLGMSVEVVGCDITREPDGLAMSSRNRYLTPEQREQASAIYRALTATKSLRTQGEKAIERLLAQFKNELAKTPALQLEYAEIREKFTLRGPPFQLDKPSVLLVAAKIGATRLIDNIELD